MSGQLQGRRIAILAADGVEQVEFEQPKEAVEAAGATTELLSLSDGEIQAVNSDINPSVRTLVEADVVRGRTLTSWPSIRTDIVNAGGKVVDEQVITDSNITSSRMPDDLPAFCARIVDEFASAAPQRTDAN